MFIAVYIFRVSHRATALHIDKAFRELALERLCLYVRQVEDSESIYGVLFVFVKALPYTHRTLLPDKLQFTFVSSGPPISPNC